MKNSDICKVFVNGTKNNAKTLSMRINYDGSKLFSYNTCIAQKLSNGAIIVNNTKYSRTTSKHQSYLRRAIPTELKTYITDKQVPVNTYDLKSYYSKQGKAHNIESISERECFFLLLINYNTNVIYNFHKIEVMQKKSTTLASNTLCTYGIFNFYTYNIVLSFHFCEVSFILICKPFHKYYDLQYVYLA